MGPLPGPEGGDQVFIDAAHSHDDDPGRLLLFRQPGDTGRLGKRGKHNGTCRNIILFLEFSDLCVVGKRQLIVLRTVDNALLDGRIYLPEVVGVDSTGIEFRNGRNGDAFRLS